MKKILFTFFINTSFVVFSSVSNKTVVVFSSVSFQNKHKTIYLDIIMNEMKTRLAFEGCIDDINCYQGVDSQGNTIVHNLLASIVQNLSDQNKEKNNKKALDALRNDVKLLNKLSKYFSEFKDKKNQEGKTPFDILLGNEKFMNIAGSIQNFKDLLSTENKKSSQKEKKRAVLVDASVSTKSKNILTSSNEPLKTKTESNNGTDLSYQQRPVYNKKNMGILFDYESLPVKS